MRVSGDMQHSELGMEDEDARLIVRRSAFGQALQVGSDAILELEFHEGFPEKVKSVCLTTPEVIKFRNLLRWVCPLESELDRAKGPLLSHAIMGSVDEGVQIVIQRKTLGEPFQNGVEFALEVDFKNKIPQVTYGVFLEESEVVELRDILFALTGIM